MPRLVNGNWDVLADYVKSARAELGMTQEELALAAGVGTSTIQLLERGEPRVQMPRTVPKIERVLRWSPGRARRIVEGLEPMSGEGTLSLTPVAITQEQKDTLRELVLRSKVMGPATREQVLAEIEATPVVTTTDE